MKGLLFKWLLVTGLLVSFHLTDIMAAHANEEPLLNGSRHWSNTVIQDDQEEGIAWPAAR